MFFTLCIIITSLGCGFYYHKYKKEVDTLAHFSYVYVCEKINGSKRPEKRKVMKKPNFT